MNVCPSAARRGTRRRPTTVVSHAPLPESRVRLWSVGCGFCVWELCALSSGLRSESRQGRRSCAASVHVRVSAAAGPGATAATPSAAGYGTWGPSRTPHSTDEREPQTLKVRERRRELTSVPLPPVRRTDRTKNCFHFFRFFARSESVITTVGWLGGVSLALHVPLCYLFVIWGVRSVPRLFHLLFQRVAIASQLRSGGLDGRARCLHHANGAVWATSQLVA